MGAEAGDDGRIPITLRIGVTGHCALADPEALRAPVREAIGRFRELLPGPGVALVVVSALAEGADRLVAEEVLAVKGARLEVALPLPEEDYLDDFPTEESKKEFRDMFRRADYVWQAPACPSREEAYAQAGRYVVDRSDAVIALWDGEPSGGQDGTAEIVGYARQQKVPLAWVKTNGKPALTYESDAKRAAVLEDAVRKLREYNAVAIKPAEGQQQLDNLRKDLIPDVTADPAPIRSACPGTRWPTGCSPISSGPTCWPCGTSIASACSAGSSSPGRGGGGGRRRAGEFPAWFKLAGRDRGCLPARPAEHLVDEPPVASVRPVDLLPLPGRAAALELLPHARRNR